MVRTSGSTVLFLHFFAFFLPCTSFCRSLGSIGSIPPSVGTSRCSLRSLGPVLHACAARQAARPKSTSSCLPRAAHQGRTAPKRTSHAQRGAPPTSTPASYEGVKLASRRARRSTNTAPKGSVQQHRNHSANLDARAATSDSDATALASSRTTVGPHRPAPTAQIRTTTAVAPQKARIFDDSTTSQNNEPPTVELPYLRHAAPVGSSLKSQFNASSPTDRRRRQLSAKNPIKVE